MTKVGLLAVGSACLLASSGAAATLVATAGDNDGKTIYATRMSWPEEAFTLTSFAAGGVGEDVQIKTILMLGSDAEIQWERTDKGIVIIPSSTPVFESNDWPVMFKLETR